jgi:hypothetical protein
MVVFFAQNDGGWTHYYVWCGNRSPAAAEPESKMQHLRRGGLQTVHGAQLRRSVRCRPVRAHKQIPPWTFMAMPVMRPGTTDPLRWARSNRRPPAPVFVESGSQLNHDDCRDRVASSTVLTVRYIVRGWIAIPAVRDGNTFIGKCLMGSVRDTYRPECSVV